jgi:hypothetical protein
MHSAMQFAQKLVNQGRFELDLVLKWYERMLKFESLTTNEFEKYALHGKETLKKLFDEIEITLTKGSMAEMFFENVKLDQASVAGVVDRIDRASDKIVISDYKTGAPLSSFSTKDKTKAVKAWRHKTQLIFYALMLQNSPLYKEKISEIDCQMIYLEAENAADLTRSYKPSAEDLERIRLLINQVWKKIKNLEMPTTSKYSVDIEGIHKFEENLLKTN